MLIKNGSTYIRVHSCRLSLTNENSENQQDTLTPPYISNWDSEDEDASTRKSTNHHSLKQTIKDEIQDYVYHEDMTCKLKKSK